MAGIIPAGAGLTGISKLPMWQIRDHPRGCRAHTYDANTSARVWGSSPRVRGSHLRQGKDDSRLGIIPAGAGLTRPRPLISRATRDHPRGCGAHVFSSPADIGGWGSSPRVRGSQPSGSFPIHEDGIIPAGAGLTIGYSLAPSIGWDHPRGCGAHTSQNGISSSGMGSSPRVRGSPTIWLYNPRDFGIIPAGAGLTPAWYCPGPLPGDHPRGCGAHIASAGSDVSPWGSSPRVRGSLSSLPVCSFNCGIIPAGAGLTATGTTRRMPAWDHPRGCGAHKRTRSYGDYLSGSSPRVRGSPQQDINIVRRTGIIPAGAGLTF